MAAAASPGSGSSAASDWAVLRDGCLRCDEQGLRSLSYHPALNAILAVTSRGSIKVIDGTSGAILQASALHAKPGGRVRCQYFPAVDKVLFVDDYVVGCRKDLNGILLLDTALQPPASKPEDMVQLELPVTEAQQMLCACQEKIDVSNTEGYDLFITQLKEGVKNTSHETAANHKVAKWATVTLHLPHHVLRLVAGAVVNELKKINQNVAALSVASSIMDRLSYLLASARPELGVGPGRSVDRSLMYSEANRRETFTSWPHAGYRWAQPDPMAQAGFYHQPASTGDDRAMCFTCSVCLVCWEPTDEPWSEHERHSPNCPFVKGEHTQNVPLSVTLATSPAQFPSGADASDKIACYGFGSCPHFLAAATKRGKICIWDVSKMMRVHLKFEINPYDPAILSQIVQSGSDHNQQMLTDSRRPTLAWLEESSTCSDLPKLEGDSDDQLEDSDSEEHSRSESVTGQASQREGMEVSLGVTALSVLQQPEKLQWEVVASVLEDTVKNLEELGANPSLGHQANKPHGHDKAKDKFQDHHNIPFPCLLAGGLLSYRPPATPAPTAGPAPARRTTDCPPLRTQSPGPLQDPGSPVQMETSAPPSPLPATHPEGVSPAPTPPSARRTMPVLLLYSIKEAEDAKSSGKVFAQMNNLMSKGLHEEGFTVPQIIEMEFDTHEQLLLQDPPITYIQQFADAAANLAGLDGHGDKWSTLGAPPGAGLPRPGALVQCLRLPRQLEEENLYVDSITPCWDGVHLLVGLQPCGVESLSAINQVEALNNLNRLNSALCSQQPPEPAHPSLANGVEGCSPPQTPLILPPAPPPQHHQHSPPRHERYSPQPRGGGYRSDEYDDSPQPSPPPVAPSPPPPVRGRDAPRHGKPHKGPGGAAPAQPPQATRGSHGDRRDRERVEERPQKKRVVEAEWSPGGGAKTAKHSRHVTPPEGKREKERGEREEREERKKGGADGRPQAPKDPGPGEEDDSDTPTMSFESFLMYDASPKTPKKKKSKPSSSSSSSHSRPPRPSSSSSSSHARTQPAAASSSSSSSSSKPSKSNGTKSSKKSEVVSSPVAATPEKRRRVVEAVPAMPDFPLPAIQPNYRPLPSLDPQPLSPQRRKVPQANGEDESGFTGKRFNSKMTVYSGTKTAYLPKMMSLYEQCLRVLQNNIDSIDEVGGVPFLILEPVLERCTPEQLYRIEECNSCFIADSDDLWLRHCQRDFRRSAPDEYESWREMYLRLHDEREERLRMLTQNISSAHANKPKGRQVKMAFVNSVAKPPRDVRRRQEKFGTLSTSTARSAAAAAPIKIRPATSYSVPGDPSQFSSSSSASYSQGSPPHGSARASLGAAVGGPPGRDKPVVKKIAPMMAKTIKAFKNRFSRR